MKTIIFALTFISLQVLASTYCVQGSGSASNFCRGGSMGSMCVRQLEQDAERRAESDADLQCRIRNGSLLRFSGYCRTYCSPPLIGERDEYVSCQATCTYSCDIP